MVNGSTSLSNQSSAVFSASNNVIVQPETSLLQGEILLKTKPHTAWGAAVSAEMYVPLQRQNVWQQLTDYPRWVEFFPDITQSKVLSSTVSTGDSTALKRIYQAASKTFLFLTAQVEIYLQVIETAEQQIQFQFESGSFADFSAHLSLKDCVKGTLVTYSVAATPLIPIPSLFIQQAINLDLPANMRQMRKALCQ